MADPTIQSAVPEQAAPAPAEAPATEAVGLDDSAPQVTAEVAPQSAPAEEAKPEGAPESYGDFTDAEGKPAFTASELGDFVNVAKELGPSQEKAQKVVSSMVPAIKAKLNNAMSASKQEWGRQLASDQELGGAGLRENLNIANKAFKQYTTPELTNLLKATGLFAHPDLVRMYYRIGKAMSQDSGVAGQGSPQPRRRMFPNSNMA